jgi:hypothetical protein
MKSDDTDAVGFDPYRKFVARRADYVFVVAAFIAATAAIVWVLLG